MISSDVNYIDFRYLNGACTIKVRFFGQEIAAGENTLHLVIICELLWKLLISPCASITRFCNPESFKTRMHEIALDSNGKRLLVTSGLVRAPIYQVSINIWLHHFIFFAETGSNDSSAYPFRYKAMKVDWGHYRTVHLSQVWIGIQHCQCTSLGLQTTLSASHLFYDL